MKTRFNSIAFLMLLTVTSSAQTKVETIAWIKGKIEKYGGYGSEQISNVSVTPCKISFKGVRHFKLFTSFDCVTNYSFDPGKTTSWRIATEGIYADSNIINLDYSGSSGNCFDPFEEEEENPKTSNILNIKKGEPDLHKNMAKALTHLATFCE